MNLRKWMLTLGLIGVVAASTVTIIWACMGSPRPSCAQTAWIGKIVPGVVIVPPGAVTVPVPVTFQPYVAWSIGLGCATPISASITVTITCPGLPVQTFMVAAPPPTAQGAQPPIMTTLTVTVPPVIPTTCTVVATYDVVFVGGIGAGTVSGTGDAQVCFVEPSEVDESKPRLDLIGVTPDDSPAIACQRGDTFCCWYVISNNDPDDTAVLSLTAFANQISRLPGGTAPNLFSNSDPNPGTDNFFVWKDGDPVPTGDPTDPNDPVNAPASTTLTLPPYGVEIIKINYGIHGMCADGSCSELLTILEGHWDLAAGGTEPAMACVQKVAYVDNSAAAKLPLCDIIDSAKSGPNVQCAWEVAQYGDDPHHTTLPGRDDPSIILDNFISPNSNPPILSSLSFPGQGEVGGIGGTGGVIGAGENPQQLLGDIIRLPEAPQTVRYTMDCTNLTSFNQVRNHVQINGFDNLPPDQPFSVPLLFNGTNNIPNLFVEIDIPVDPVLNPNIRISFGNNEAFNGDLFAFYESPPEFIAPDFETCRTFVKRLPSGEQPLQMLGVAPHQVVQLLPPNGGAPPLIDVFEAFSGDPLTWSATSSDSRIIPNPASTTILGTQLGLDFVDIPTAPELVIAKVDVLNPSTFNERQTVVVAARTLPEVMLPDSDGDGVADADDNCVDVFNPRQRDTDRDGIGNACDPDLNNDGIVNIADFNIFRGGFGTSVGDPLWNADADLNGNGVVDIADFNVFRGLFGQTVQASKSPKRFTPATVGVIDQETHQWYLSDPILADLRGGSNEVPNPGDPDGDGRVFLTFNQDTNKIFFDFELFQVEKVTAAHIHRGAAGVAGPVVVNLDWPNQGKNGSVDVDSALIDEILADLDLFYVNVHSEDFPGGAVRGQLSGGPILPFTFGLEGDIPLLGDFDGDGVDDLAIFRPSNQKWYLSSSSDSPAGTIDFYFGDDVPLVGDWDGDGDDSVSLYRPSEGKFFINNKQGSVTFSDIEIEFLFGDTSADPFAGDFDSDGKDTVGVRVGNEFRWKNTLSGGAPDGRLVFGEIDDKPMFGDWDGDGLETPGLYRPSNGTILLRNLQTPGIEDMEIFTDGFESGDVSAWSR